MITVSCILINYNTSHYTIPCVQSIINNTQHTEISYEIIIVDNASKIDDYNKLKKGLKEIDSEHIKLVRSKQNVGFGGGNMIGVLNAAPCEYYAFINNDTLLVTPETLYSLAQFMRATPDAGIASPQMLDEHKNFRVTIDYFSSLQREILRRPLLEKLFPDRYLDRKRTYDKPTPVQYVQGSFMFCDASDFNDIGGFDTNLFLYYEESDVSLRLLRQKNKKNYLIPSLEYIHYKGISTPKSIFIKIEQKLSLLYHTRKHYGWFQHKTLLTYFRFRYLFTALFKPKYWKLFWVLIKGAPLAESLKQKQAILKE